MECKGISKENDKFVPRKNADEFFRDGIVVKELYQKTFELINDCSSLSIISILDVFNNAYQICRARLFQKPFISIIRNKEKKDFVYSVALVLIMFHRKFYSISDVTISNLRSSIRPSIWEIYETFAEGKSLSHPIDFCKPTPEPEFDVDLAIAKNYMLSAMDKAIRLEEENKLLSEQLQAERIAREKAEQTIRELQEKLDVWESDDFYKAVNIKTIIEYAQDTDNCDKNDVAIIKLMLLGLCANKVPDKVIRKIKTLKCGGKLNIGTVGQINPAATEVHNHYHNND